MRLTEWNNGFLILKRGTLCLTESPIYMYKGLIEVLDLLDSFAADVQILNGGPRHGHVTRLSTEFFRPLPQREGK